MASNLKKAKDRCWKTFSKYIRLRDCLETTNTMEWGLCVTCSQRKHFKELQAGHFLGGRGNSILFDERGVFAQCRQCNYQSGNPVEYFRFMQQKHGDDVIDELRLKKNQAVKWTEDEYDALNDLLKDKIKDLER